MVAHEASQGAQTPRTYRPSRLDRAFFSLQLFIAIGLLVGVVIGILSGVSGAPAAPVAPAAPSSSAGLPIGAVIGIVAWIALIAGYLVAGRGAVTVTADGVDVIPYLGRSQHVPWADISEVTVASTSPYASGIYGAGSWVEVFLSRTSGRGIGLQATRRPKGQQAAVEAVRDEIANEAAAHR